MSVRGRLTSRGSAPRTRERHRARSAPLLPGVLFLAVVGCSGFGETKPPRPDTLTADRNAPLVVAMAVTDQFRARHVTALESIRVRPSNENLYVWHSLPGTNDWAPVPRPEKGLVSEVALVDEGVHLFAAAPMGATPRKTSLEVSVDRRPPQLRVRFERMRNSSRAGSHFRLRWRMDDAHMHPNGFRIEWRDPTTREWTLLSDELPSAGTMLWPYPKGEPGDHRVRCVATDLAANESQVEVDLTEAFDRREWTVGRPKRPAASPEDPEPDGDDPR